jgi:hypothetical protein
MPGPNPTDPARRRRTNKVAGARTLRVVPSLKTPALPDRPTPWHPMTEAWWAGIWGSPMAPEYDTSDTNELYLLAVLVDEFWREPSKELASEIRLQRQCFGLTPIDRRRLQWEIDRGEEAEERAAKRKAAAKPRAASTRKDPRKMLA